MARKRMVSPEFFTDVKIGECSSNARLLFVASWCFADDCGSLIRSAKQLKAQAFPFDNIDCEPLILELLAQGLLVEYETKGEKFLHIQNFTKHQRIDRPGPPRVPVYEGSSKARRALVPNLKEVKLKKEKKNPPPPLKPNGHAPDPDGLDPAAWMAWQAYRKLKPQSVPLAKKKLAGFGLSQLAVVEQSIANGWQGLFALKDQSTLPFRPKTADQLDAEEAARERQRPS